MSELEIQEHYKQQIEQADSFLEKNLLKAEMNHKLKLASVGESTDYAQASSNSDFECIGCGS
jgi:hypothetical protein